MNDRCPRCSGLLLVRRDEYGDRHRECFACGWAPAPHPVAVMERLAAEVPNPRGAPQLPGRTRRHKRRRSPSIGGMRL